MKWLNYLINIPFEVEYIRVWIYILCKLSTNIHYKLFAIWFWLIESTQFAYCAYNVVHSIFSSIFLGNNSHLLLRAVATKHYRKKIQLKSKVSQRTSVRTNKKKRTSSLHTATFPQRSAKCMAARACNAQTLHCPTNLCNWYSLQVCVCVCLNVSTTYRCQWREKNAQRISAHRKKPQTIWSHFLRRPQVYTYTLIMTQHRYICYIYALIRISLTNSAHGDADTLQRWCVRWGKTIYTTWWWYPTARGRFRMCI